MTFDRLEQMLFATWHDGNFTAKYDVLGEFLASATGLDRGRALCMIALLQFFEDVRNVLSALRLVEEAQPLIAGHPRSMLMSAFDGLSYAETAGDRSRAALQAKRIRATLAVYGAHPDVQPWLGRAFLALGQHHESAGRLDDALTWFDESVAYHERSGGPHSESDRRCYVILSYAGRCEVQVRMQRWVDAQASLEAGRRWDPTGTNPSLVYAEALWLHHTGNSTGAISALNKLHGLAQLQHEHRLRFQVCELRALCLAQLGDVAGVRASLRSAIDDAAAVNNLTMLLRLQRVLKRARLQSA